MQNKDQIKNQTFKEQEIQSFNEKRIRKITNLYYSRPEIQKAIFEFSKSRETIPRYYEGFGKRPDSLEYKGDVFELVKKGATSFHCSEELWQDPLKLSTDLTEEQLNDLRTGFDLLIDIDSKYFDYSKILAELIIKILKFHGVKNISVKFSGSKGWHILVPWKAFPKEINEIQTKNLFPKWPRIIIRYLIEQTKDKLIEKISDLEKPSKYIKDFQAPKQVMPDIILVSPRHLFRAPLSLHEKTALASVVVDSSNIFNFELKDADPLKLSKEKIKNFMPDAKENEAKELLIAALDWYKQAKPDESSENEKTKRISKEFKPIKIDKLSEKNFSPCLKNISKGLRDGRKRSLFVLINLFRSIGMDKDELQSRIDEWNKKNKPFLKEGYIKSQISWAYKKVKVILPPNCKEFYQGIGVCQPDDFCKLIKNPVNYLTRKNFIENKQIQFKKRNKKQKKVEK